MKEESERAGFKLYLQKMKIMASGPITSWQMDGRKMETVTDFIFLGYKIAVDGDCSPKIKRHLTPWKKSYDKLNLRYHFADKGPSSQSYVFSSSHVRM